MHGKRAKIRQQRRTLERDGVKNQRVLIAVRKKKREERETADETRSGEKSRGAIG